MEEVANIRAERQVNNTLNQRNGPSIKAIHDLPLNSDVLVWREGNTGQSGKWTDPFKLIGLERETCKAHLPSGPTDFRTTVVKPYLQPESEPESEDEEDKEEPAKQDNTLQDKQPRLNTHRTRRPPTRSRQNTTDISIFLQDDLKPPSPFYTDSRQKELNGLLKKGVFKVVNIANIPQGVRIFNSRFVDEIKNASTDKAFEKSRLVVQAYYDHDRASPDTITNHSTCQPETSTCTCSNLARQNNLSIPSRHLPSLCPIDYTPE
jgi:hypothetical protein